MTDTKHKPATPLPWQFFETGAENMGGAPMQWGAVYGVAPRDCIASGMRLQTAAYIAHAANAYPRLVEALHRIEARFNAFDSQHPSLCTNEATRQLLADVQVDHRALLRELGETP